MVHSGYHPRLGSEDNAWMLHGAVDIILLSIVL